jgi:hypothetical protein
MGITRFAVFGIGPSKPWLDSEEDTPAFDLPVGPLFERCSHPEHTVRIAIAPHASPTDCGAHPASLRSASLRFSSLAQYQIGRFA